MTRLFGTIATIIATHIVVPLHVGKAESADPVSRINWHECAYKVAGEVLRCGSLDLPENYKQPRGNRVSLPFAVLPSMSETPSSDPVVYFNGGPGASAMEALASLSAIGHIRENRELIVVEHRGTPAATPSLVCGDEARLLAECYSKAVEAGIDLQQYNNVNTARDFNELRKALGVDRWNLFGISYGTTLAMYYMRDYPDTVRAVILDSPTAPDTDIARADVTSQLDGISRMVTVCQRDVGCRGEYGDLRTAIIEQVSQLREEAFKLTLERVRERYGESLDAREFILGVAHGLQSASRMLTVPAFIDAVSERNEGRIARIMDVQIQPAPRTIGYDLPMSARGLTLSIYCGELHYSRYEDGPGETLEHWPKELVELMMPGYYIHCKAGRWPIAPVDRKLLTTVTSGLPTVVLLGAMDPITSVREADRAMAGLENSRLVIVPATTHGVTDRQCAQEIVAQFLQSPRKELTTGCLKDISEIRFITDL